jgi:predicted Zn-dependent peptidase
VARVKRSDLQSFHRKHFAPNNAFLVVVGDVTADQVSAAAAKAFKGWRKRQVEATEYPDPPAREQREVVIVDRPQSVQSVIYVGNLAIERSNPDYVPLLVANQVLGGSAASRLFMDLREKRSLTYGAYSAISERVHVAPFIAYAAVRNEVTSQAMGAFAEHLDQIVAEAPPEPELKNAQRFLVDRFPLRIDTAGKIADLVADLRIYGLPDDYWEGFRTQIGQVSPEAALAAAKEHIRPDESLIVVVGKAADVKPALEAYGPVTVVDTEGEVVIEPAAETTATDGKPAASGTPKEK